jgi:hypothetical protein
MENKRRTPTRPSMASRLLSTLESAGLAAATTFAGMLWIGLALPGRPLLPGVGGGQNSNVAISLSSAVLGVQDSRTFAHSHGIAGRQTRLLSLLLPSPDLLARKLATRRLEAAAPSGAPMVLALPPLQTGAPGNETRAFKRSQVTSLVAPAPSPSVPSPPTPPPPPTPPAPPRGTPAPSPAPQAPDPDPQTPTPPTDISAPPPTDTDTPAAGVSKASPKKGP